MDDVMRKVLADILSEGTRNPRIASILTQANLRLRERIASAALIWIPDPEHDAERKALADLILTACGALHHRQIFGLGTDAAITCKMIAMVEAEIERVSTPSQRTEAMTALSGQACQGVKRPPSKRES